MVSDAKPVLHTEHFVDCNLVLDHGIHGAQQMLVLDGCAINAGQAHGLKPAKHPQFGVWIAQSVKDHDAHQRLNINGVASASE